MFSKIIILFLTIGAINCYPTEDYILDIEGRVVGGVDAGKGEFPYMISLRSSSGSHSCGGSIINDEWILTAAHCISGAKPSIQYGSNQISSNGPIIAKVKRVIRHKEYNPSKNYLNDIALLQLETKIKFTKSVQPVQLPEQKQEFEHGTHAVLSGWGYDKTGGSVQKNLQKVDLITFSDEECTKRHKGRTGPSQICGGLEEGGKGQCSGDSGGPLTVNGVQVGIVSWSIKPCAIYPYPGVYTKVSHFVDWIKENIATE